MILRRYIVPVGVAFACGFAQGAVGSVGAWQIPAVIGLAMFVSMLTFKPEATVPGSQVPGLRSQVQLGKKQEAQTHPRPEIRDQRSESSPAIACPVIGAEKKRGVALTQDTSSSRKSASL